MPIRSSIAPPLARVTLDNPDKLNALTPEERFELGAVFEQLQHEPDVRAVVISGAGRAFCAGADVGRMTDQGLVASRTRMQRGGHRLIVALANIEKPVIAAVRGAAAGMGWSIALAADFIIASETAKFSLAFVKRGLAPDAGAIHMLMRHIGQLRAKELVYTARAIDAQEALALGLVTQVVPDAELEKATEALAAKLCEEPTRAIGLSKKLFQFASGPSLAEFLEYEAFVQPELNQSEDFKEGVAAFREKRAARYVGR